MIEASLPTYYANIWLGLKNGYDGEIGDIQFVKNYCQEYVEKGLCVTITETEFIYTGGNEPGVIIGLINYPRFPKEDGEVLAEAIQLAEQLMRSFEQYRCSIVTPHRTFLMENEDKKDENS